MPLYEYQCERDGRFEKIEKFSDPPLKVCPKCGGPVQRLLSAPAIQFKGTGWYVTDYARKSGGEGSKDKGAGKDSGASSSTGESGGSSTGEASKGEASKGEASKGEAPKKAASGSKKGS